MSKDDQIGGGPADVEAEAVNAKVEALADMRIKIDLAKADGKPGHALEYVFEQAENEILQSGMTRNELGLRLRREVQHRQVERLLRTAGDIDQKLAIVTKDGHDLAVKYGKLSAEMEELKSKVQTLKRESAPLPRPWLYIILLAIVVLFVGGLIYYGQAAKPTVAINYNVGEIIGGLLVGISAVIAGITYALRHGEVRR
jgi:hypothetical protein